MHRVTAAGWTDVLDKPANRDRAFTCLFEESPIPTAYVGKDGTFLRVNQAYCELLGYSASELVGRLKYQNVTHPDDVTPDEREANLVVEGESTRYQMYKRYINKANRVVDVHLSVLAVVGDDEKFLHFVAHAVRVDNCPPLTQPDSNQAIYPMVKWFVDNWKRIAAVVVPTAGAVVTWAVATLNSYQSMAARLEYQQTLMEDHKVMIEKLTANVKDAVEDVRPKSTPKKSPTPE